MSPPRLPRKRIVELMIPLVVVLLLAAATLRSGVEITPELLMNYTPKHPVLAVLALWGMFGLKSLSVFFPISALFIASGWLFPLPAALAVNLVGFFITASIPYAYGRLCGQELAPTLSQRSPKLDQLRRATQAGDLPLTILMRLLGLPCDLVSTYLGAAGVPYFKYISGCLIGFFPRICLPTILGGAILEPGSPQFLLSLALYAVLLVFTLVFSRFYLRHRRL